LPFQHIADVILADSPDTIVQGTLLTFGFDAMEGAELAGTAEEEGVENLFGRNAGKAATIRQGRGPGREVEHFIRDNLQLVPDQA
jgi:hypothetical protein